MARASFVDVSRRAPCPLCAGTTDCRLNAGGGVHCRRVDQYAPPAGWRFAKVDAVGFGVFYPDDGNTAAERFAAWAARRVQLAGEAYDRAVGGKRKATSASRFDEIGAARRPLEANERDAIASALCLPLAVLDVLPVEFLPNDGSNRWAYTIPERDGNGRVIGWNLRYADSSKRTHGARGLFVPIGWNMTPGMVVIPEGASDTMALTALGLAAIGRPSNLGGGDHLAAMLNGYGFAGDDSRPVVILGENDAKPNGQWPGRDGAEAIARKLAEELRREVWIAYPPAGYKDVREYVTGHKAAILARETTLAAVGLQLAEHIERTKVVIGDRVSDPAAISVTTMDDEVRALAGAAVDVPLAFAELPAGDGLPKFCPKPWGVVLRSDSRHATRFTFVACGHLGCPVCGERRRAQYKATVRKTLTDEADAGTSEFFVLWCAADRWETTHRALRRVGAEYFRLKIGGDRLMIVANREPKTDAASEAIAVTAEEAGARLFSTIDRLPVEAKVFASSHGWPIVEDEAAVEKSDWKRIGANSQPLRKVVEIIEAYRATWRPVAHASRFAAGWQAIEVPDDGLPSGATVERLIESVWLGEVMPADLDPFGSGLPGDVHINFTAGVNPPCRDP